MPWLPNASVTINSVLFTSQTLEGLTINYGRSSVWEQSRSSYARIQILNTTDVNHNFEIGQEVVIKIDDSVGTPKTVFTGVLIDVTSQIGGTGSVGETTIQTITAVGPFAQMARTTIGGSNWTSETDTDRMNTIFTEAGVDIDIIDSPYIYEFINRAGSVADAYSLASSYAQQAFGYIYETTDGKVGYANESHRLNEVQANGYFEIPEDNILWSNFRSQRSRNDIVNDVSLTYDGGASVSSTNAASVSSFGIAGAKINTEIKHMADAQIIADRYVAVRGFPQYNISAFTIMLDSPNIADATRDKLVNVYMGLPIFIENLPLAVSPGIYKGFIEGWTFTINRVQTELQIITTDSSYSIPPTRWQDVDPATTWDDVDPAVQWYLYE
jgi:hypothetical protein